MSDQIGSVLPIPKETARRARASYGKNNFYIQTGEQLITILEDIKPEYLLDGGVILPLITVFQFLEGLTDTQSADAVRRRIDWKFALHLPSYSPAFHESELCKFRQKVLNNPGCQHEFEMLVERLIPFDPPQVEELQNRKSPEIIIMVCSINQLEKVYEAINLAMDALARNFPEWLRMVTLPHWYGRYARTIPSLDLAANINQRELLSQEIFSDIHYLVEENQRSGYAAINELEEMKYLEFLSALQKEKTDQLLGSKKQPLHRDGCEFCINNKRTFSDNKHDTTRL
jgi:transposase